MKRSASNASESMLRLRDQSEVIKLAKAPNPSIVRHCCVRGCKSSSLETNLRFYNFPTCRNSKTQSRRKLWLQAVITNCEFSKDWQPYRHTLICSKHFVGGKKSEHLLHPAYEPTIFPIREGSKHRVEEMVWDDSHESDSSTEKVEHSYYKSSKEKDDGTVSVKKEKPDDTVVANFDFVLVKEEIREMIDFGCQVNIFFSESHVQPVNYMICNRIIKNGINCAETQANIELKSGMSSKKEVKNELFNHLVTQSINFEGISVINSNNDLQNMCGVSFKVFNLLLRDFPSIEEIKISQANTLLIFLMKIKQGIDYDALALIFGLPAKTVSDMCLTCVKRFANTFKIIWPSRNTVVSRLPFVFQKYSPNCRAVIDVIDIHVEVPDNHEKRIYLYQDVNLLKINQNFQFFLACAPNGVIIFKGECHSDPNSDKAMMSEKIFVNRLESGDTILANREIPSIRTKLENKKISLFSAPFSDKTYLGTLDVNVKECINRIKSFKILSALPSDLISEIDQVLHVCCCLINMEILKK